jgi:hypothetical protein
MLLTVPAHRTFETCGSGGKDSRIPNFGSGLICDELHVSGAVLIRKQLRNTYWIRGRRRYKHLIIEALRSSETPVCFNEITRRYIPEGCNFSTSRRENLKSH